MTTPKKPLANAPERFAEMRDKLCDEYFADKPRKPSIFHICAFKDGFEACAKAFFECSEVRKLVEELEKSACHCKPVSQICDSCYAIHNFEQLKSELGE